MPTNSSGVPIDPDRVEPQRRLQPRVDDRHLRRRARPRAAAAPRRSPTSVRRCDADQPIVLLDTDTGRRWPFFAELDAQADPARPARAHHPTGARTSSRATATSSRSATCATRAARRSPPDRGFQLYRDRIPTFTPAVEARRPHLERVFDELDRAGVDRDEPVPRLGLHGGQRPRTWPAGCSTSATTRSPSLHGGVPAFTVDQVRGERRRPDLPPGHRHVHGPELPHRRRQPRATGSRTRPTPGPDALPVRNGDVTAGFICNIPRSATADGNDPVTPARGGVYGHGLLGSNDEVNAGNVRTMGERAQLRVLRDEVGRLLRGRHRHRGRRRCRTSPTSRRSPTGRSRAS